MRSSRVVPHPHLGLTELSVQEGGFRGWGVPYLGLTLAGEFVDDLKLREQPMRRERKIPLPARERLHRAHQRVVLLVFLFFFFPLCSLALKFYKLLPSFISRSTETCWTQESK